MTLSPLLFTLVADGLNATIQKAKKRGLIKGLHASKKVFIINLQYADDTILFERVDIGEAIVWKWIIHIFEL